MDEFILNSRFSNLLIKSRKPKGRRKNDNSDERQQYWKNTIREIYSDVASPYSDERRGNKPIVQVSRQEKLPIGVDSAKPK